MNAVVAGSEQDQATEIRFFDVSSRLGRVRYLAYGWALGLMMSPLTLASLYEWLHGAWALGSGIFLIDWIIATPIHFTFMIRRLHDMGRSGWWCLIYVFSIPFSFVRLFEVLHHTQPGPLHLLVNLVVLGFVLMLLFAPGSAGPNRFGLQPPPNSAGVIALAWSTLLLPVFVIIAVAVFVSTVDFQKIRAAKAVETARAAVYPATRYFQENHHWPVDLASLDNTRPSDPAVGSFSTITYPDGSYGIIAWLKNSSEAVEVWTTNNGANWHCGSARGSTLSSLELPKDCQEEPPPAG